MFLRLLLGALCTMAVYGVAEEAVARQCITGQQCSPELAGRIDSTVITSFLLRRLSMLKAVRCTQEN
eukprot:SAG11_NODE_1635_length_4539_cov_2.188514_2_plen_67_part_00